MWLWQKQGHWVMVWVIFSPMYCPALLIITSLCHPRAWEVWGVVWAAVGALEEEVAHLFRLSLWQEGKPRVAAWGCPSEVLSSQLGLSSITGAGSTDRNITQLLSPKVFLFTHWTKKRPVLSLWCPVTKIHSSCLDLIMMWILGLSISKHPGHLKLTKTPQTTHHIFQLPSSQDVLYTKS